MRHSHVKLKKMLQDRCAELEHARSRAEQYEAEVKKLRCRIEELKSDLSSVEDEVRGSVECASNVVCISLLATSAEVFEICKVAADKPCDGRGKFLSFIFL